VIIAEITPKENFILLIKSQDNILGEFDVSPYLHSEAFSPLQERHNFEKVINGYYFIEWECGADLSADTIEAKWNIIGQA